MLLLRPAGGLTQRRLTRAGSFSDGRIIVPGQDRNRSQPGRIIMPGQLQSSNPSAQQAPGKFPGMGQEVAGSSAPAPPRNFRPPTGFMNEGGPDEDIYAGKSIDELIMLLSTRSDHWYNLARAFPKLYAAGHDRAGLEEITNVDPSRQNVWSVAAEVFHSLKAQLTPEQQSYFQYEDSSPDCLMELRFLDLEKRVNGARYIADQQLSREMATVLARAIKERQRRGEEAAAGFTVAAGDCLAFKYYRDAQECRNMDERTRYIAKGLKVAVTASAEQRLQELQQAPENKLPSADAPVATLEVARLQKDELGARPIPVIGAYGHVKSIELESVASLGGNGAFQMMKLPPQGGEAVILPRWNVLALAAKPAVLTISDITTVPELLQGKTTSYKGNGLLVVDTGDRKPEEGSFYLAEVDGVVKLMPGSDVQEPLARACIVCLPPRQSSISPDAFDV